MYLFTSLVYRFISRTPILRLNVDCVLCVLHLSGAREYRVV